MTKTGKIILTAILLIGFLFYGLPNLINQKERANFSTKKRLELAQATFNMYEGRSMIRPVSDFYNRSQLTRILFGEHYRDVWSQPVQLPIFTGFDSLTFHKVGGGLQTTSIEVLDGKRRSFTLRTLDKDQSRPLPNYLKNSALRPLLRDQTSALNPYNSKVVAVLSTAVDIVHTKPELYIIPYSDSQHDSINYYLAGKVVLFEEEPGSKWSGQNRFNRPVDIVSTDEMFKTLDDGNYTIDTLAYLKCRLFDLLLSDWDRHGGQWKWLLQSDSIRNIIVPMPIDRDMALCRFDDGLVNQLVIALSNKFKSFRESKESILDAAKKITDMDHLLLKGVDKSSYLNLADQLKEQLTDLVIKEAFEVYPPPIFELIGEDHITTMMVRRSFLNEAAEEFYSNIQE